MRKSNIGIVVAVAAVALAGTAAAFMLSGQFASERSQAATSTVQSPAVLASTTHVDVTETRLPAGLLTPVKAQSQAQSQIPAEAAKPDRTVPVPCPIWLLHKISGFISESGN